LFGANIDGIVRARGPASIVALVGLIWPAPTVVYTLTLTLNEMWGTAYSDGSAASFIEIMN